MSERTLVTKIVRTAPDRADLYGRGHRYKDFTLFDLSELGLVGIDYNALEEGKEFPCRFWAIYELSDKINKAGNPYKDIVTLEAIDKPATATSTDNSALLQAVRDLAGEMRGIKALLLQALSPGPAPARDPYPAGSPTADEDNPQEPDARQPGAGGQEARMRFYDLVTQALADGVPQATTDALLELAGLEGFSLAAQCLAAELKRPAGKEADYRRSLVARVAEILAIPLVATGQVEHKLAAGWQWLATNNALLDEGKRLVAAIEKEGGEV